MKRASAFAILKKDLGNSVQRKRLNKDIIEYWVYKGKPSLLYTPNGKKWTDDKNKKLNSIIVCESGQNHILRDNEKAIVVIGMKVTEKELTDYIHYRETIKDN